MSTQLKVFIKHDDLPDEEGPNTVAMVVSEDALATDNSVKFIEAVGEAVDAARKRVAGDHLVDYNSFGSDSSYLDRIDEVVREMSVQRLEVVGEKSTFTVNGTAWDDDVFKVEAAGTSSAEAAFHAVWDKIVSSGTSPGADFEYFLESMVCDFEIEEVEPKASSAPTP